MLGLSKKVHIHFVGIGGIGMSGIAEVLLSLGYPISGSDLAQNPTTEALAAKGARVCIGHRAENLADADLVVYSTAIDPTNPEIALARQRRIPIVRRAEMLAELMRLKYGIAIAGSHGKTTTTSMVATIFHLAKRDPTHIIGGVVSNLGGHAKKGDGDVLIAEADESDGSFLFLNPIMAVVTNVDNDHLDYHKTEENIRRAFVEFVNRIPFYGKVALNAQDAGTRMILPEVKRQYVLFGLEGLRLEGQSLDYSASNISFAPGATSFELLHKGVAQGTVSLAVSGQHNVMNALAAIAISHEAGISFADIRAGLAKFSGVGRRLESVLKRGAFEVIDDYGHHPTEIRATLRTLKDVYRKEICVVFEPHRYSRTQQLWTDFVESFHDASEVFVAPIYAASEAPIEGVDSRALVADMVGRGVRANYLASLDDMAELLRQRASREMVFLTLGAGAISKKIKSIAKEL